MNVVILEPIGVSKDYVQKIAKKYFQDSIKIVQYDQRAESDEELIERSKNADVLIISNQPLSRSILQYCPNTKLISVAFTGVDHIDMDYCREKNITVCNSSGYANVAVTELVFGMAINLFRSIFTEDTATRNGGIKSVIPGRELYGKTFGVIGAGAIGQQVATLAKAFGCNVLIYSKTTPRSLPGIDSVTLEKLLKESDIVSLHVPLTEYTKDLINTKELSMMRKTAILINTARGPVVNAEALAAALNSEKIAGAAIDVFDCEPPLPKKNPLLHSKNTLVTPHIGFATGEAYEKRCKTVFENINKWKNGTPQNVMN